jgi:hypothetical protein
MTPVQSLRPARLLSLLLAFVLAFVSAQAMAYAGAGDLHAKYTELRERLNNNVSIVPSTSIRRKRVTACAATCMPCSTTRSAKSAVR